MARKKKSENTEETIATTSATPLATTISHKIDSITIDGATYAIDLPFDATPTIESLTVNVSITTPKVEATTIDATEVDATTVKASGDVSAKSVTATTGTIDTITTSKLNATTSTDITANGILGSGTNNQVYVSGSSKSSTGSYKTLSATVTPSTSSRCGFGHISSINCGNTSNSANLGARSMTLTSSSTSYVFEAGYLYAIIRFTNVVSSGYNYTESPFGLFCPYSVTNNGQTAEGIYIGNKPGDVQGMSSIKALCLGDLNGSTNYATVNAINSVSASVTLSYN